MAGFSTPSYAGGPTWETIDLVALGLSGTVQGFIVEPSSPAYLGTGTEVNGYILTTTQVRTLNDIFGTPSLGTAHTLPISGLASIETERASNSPVVVTIHDDNGTNGVYVVYSTNEGSSWTDYQITTTEFTTGGFPHSAPVAVSAHTGNVYTTVPLVDLPSGSRASQAKVANVSALSTWAASSKFDTGHALSDQLHFPFADTADNTAWCNYVPSTAPDTGSYLYRYIGGSGADKSPSYGGVSHSMRANFARHAIDTFTGDKRIVAFCGAGSSNVATRFSFGLWTSTDEGDTWTNRIAPVFADEAGSAGAGIQAPTGVDITGSNGRTLYVHGTDGYVAYSSDFGATIDVRTGDLSTSAYVVRILGG